MSGRSPVFGLASVLAVIIISLAGSGCTTIRSGAHLDEAADFKDYRRFSWIADDPLIVGAGQALPVSPLARKKIEDAILAELTEHGFVFVADREAADFVVSYTVGARDRIDATSYPVGYRGAWGWHLYGRYYVGAEVVHRTYTEGTLGIDVFDGKSRQPVWHGWATKTITRSDRDDPTASIRKAVSAIFARFPPIDRP